MLLRRQQHILQRFAGVGEICSRFRPVIPFVVAINSKAATASPVFSSHHQHLRRFSRFTQTHQQQAQESHPAPSEMSEDKHEVSEDKHEMSHLLGIAQCWNSYESWNLWYLRQQESDWQLIRERETEKAKHAAAHGPFTPLPVERLYARFQERVKLARQALSANQGFCQEIVNIAYQMFPNLELAEAWERQLAEQRARRQHWMQQQQQQFGGGGRGGRNQQQRGGRGSGPGGRPPHVDAELLELEKTQLRAYSSFNMPKVGQTIKQFVRDWSAEGKKERELVYGPILEEIEAHFGHLQPAERAKIRILTPGCGLARLPWEISRMGFYSEGNEFTYFMLLANAWVLHARAGEKMDLFPFAHDFLNAYTNEQQSRRISIPDVEDPSAHRVMMQAGDFLVEYRRPQHAAAWNCVATCFFLDTAHNVLDYMEAIARLLPVGGVWVNLGPLLWHYSDMKSRQASDRENSLEYLSLELTFDDIKDSMEWFGLKLVREELHKELWYNRDLQSMSYTAYSGVLFTCVKVAEPRSGVPPSAAAAGSSADDQQHP